MAGFDFTQKAVVIVGHGSFAVENARHAIEQGASQVVLLARHDQLVMSRAAGLFVDRHVDQGVPAAAVLEALRAPYRLIGRDAEMEEIFFRPARAMLPTSDFYFLARAAGRLRVVIGEVAMLSETAVQTRCGASFPADLLITCTGFALNKAFDRAMRSDLQKGGRCSVFHHVSATTRMTPFSQFTGGSGGFRHFSPSYSFVAKVESMPAHELATRSAELKTRVARRSRSRPLADFLREQQREWAEYCSLLGVSISYPYTLDNMHAWEHMVANAPAPTSLIGRDHLLVAQRADSRAARQSLQDTPAMCTLRVDPE